MPNLSHNNLITYRTLTVNGSEKKSPRWRRMESFENQRVRGPALYSSYLRKDPAKENLHHEYASITDRSTTRQRRKSTRYQKSVKYSKKLTTASTSRLWTYFLVITNLV